MYAQKKPTPAHQTATATLTAVSNKVTRLFLDENLAGRDSNEIAVPSYSCRCSESKVDPTIMCPSHWLSFTMQFAPSIH